MAECRLCRGKGSVTVYLGNSTYTDTVCPNCLLTKAVDGMPAALAAARREGAEAMRQAAAKIAEDYEMRRYPASRIAAEIRALPLPGDAEGGA